MREPMEHAGRLLARRARSEGELAVRLREAGHSDEIVAATVARLRALELVNDRQFARDYVAQRLRRSPRGGAALRAELAARAVPPELIAEAVDEVAGDEEERRATELAVGLAARMTRLAPRDLAGRLGRRLASRGFSDEVIEVALRAALPPEGWD